MRWRRLLRAPGGAAAEPSEAHGLARQPSAAGCGFLTVSEEEGNGALWLGMARARVGKQGAPGGLGQLLKARSGFKTRRLTQREEELVSLSSKAKAAEATPLGSDSLRPAVEPSEG